MTDSKRKIQASHLSRNAFLYVRQSTLRQVTENQESTRRQYALRERAIALGWVVDQVVVVDCDQGVSGASTDREGFQRLVAEVGMGRAGIVLGLEVSRLARNSTDWHRLLEICGLTETLILDEDGLYDPTDYNDRLLLGLKGTLSEAELHMLRARLRGGLLAKARRGELCVGLPVGLVYDELGHVVLHPDAQVRDSIQLFFRTFFRTSTACATVKYFTEHNILFPAPATPGGHGDAVLWGRLSLSRAVQLLHNPRYAGAYAYGRRSSRKQIDGRSRTARVPREQWQVLLLDVHPGYISWHDYERVQQQLSASAVAYGRDRRHGPPREGPALLQGLAICGRCGARMTVRYHRRDGQLVPDYGCHVRTMQYRVPTCQFIPGGDIDAAIGRLLVETMSPLAVELTLAVQDELETRFEETDRLRRQQVERADNEVLQARRRYLQVDPSNRLVASSLEADWNDKLRALDEIRDRVERERTADRSTLDQKSQERVRALAADFPAVWNDRATPHRERKRMAALLLSDVTVLKEQKHITLGVRFRGGTTTTLRVPIPLNAWRKRLTHPNVVARVDELLSQGSDTEVAERLNADGMRTGAGQRFDANAVQWVRYTHGLKTARQRLHETGKLTIHEMAARLALPETTIRSWARDGRLHAARHGAKATWLIEPLDEQPEEIRKLGDRGCDTPATARPPQATAIAPELRARVDELLGDGHHDAAVAEQLNREGWCRPTGAAFYAGTVRRIRQRCGLQTLWERMRQAGMLTTPEMAVRLGLGIATVHSWARAGLLHDRPAGKARRARRLFDPLDQQPKPARARAAARATMARRPGRPSLLSDAAAGSGAV
jgi:excisionase family DNA binding protein